MLVIAKLSTSHIAVVTYPRGYDDSTNCIALFNLFARNVHQVMCFICYTCIWTTVWGWLLLSPGKANMLTIWRQSCVPLWDQSAILYSLTQILTMELLWDIISIKNFCYVPWSSIITFLDVQLQTITKIHFKIIEKSFKYAIIASLLLLGLITCMSWWMLSYWLDLLKHLMLNTNKLPFSNMICSSSSTSVCY